MSTPTTNVQHEDQAHFDQAWDAREVARARLGRLGEAAAGPRAAMSEVAKQGRRLAQDLGDPDEAVAIGRIDDPDEVLYVGRRTILDAEKDVLVVSWASPDAQRFYTATATEPQGLTRKRSYTTRKNRIESVDDLLFKDLADRLERLDGMGDAEFDDVLLKDLERDRSNEMRDIVQTIHQSQYHIIKRPLEDLLVVQGGPGTGKTAVALHRVAWLLYNFRDILPAESVLVVSPNRAFTEYIRKVLPSLGEGGVGHADLTRLGPVASTGRTEPFETTRLKGDLRMVELLRRALWNRVRPPEEPRIAVETPNGQVRIAGDDLRRTIARWRNTGSSAPYSARRADLKRIISDLVLQQAGRRAVDQPVIERVTERIWPSLTPARFVQELLGSRQRLTEAAGDDFTAGDIERLYRQAASSLGSEEWAHADVALVDEAEWLINGRRSGHAHVVVDEAQDLSAMQLRSLARLCPTGSYTIVGDLAQSTGPWARDSWDDVFSALKTRSNKRRLETLEYGYRVPRQVFELARPLVQLAAPEVRPPIVVRDSSREPVVAPCHPDEVSGHAIREAKDYASSGLLVGVIAPEALVGDVRSAFSAANTNVKSPADGHLGTSINLMTAAESKGLEFDAIVVVEPAGIVAESAHGLRLLYIALTRTTRFASVVFSRDLAEIGLLGAPVAGDGLSVDPTPSLSTGTVAQPMRADVLTTPATKAQGGSARGKRNARAERIVADTVADIAADIEATLAPALYAPLIEALADLLGVDCLVDD
ncbi:HelD family protein [Tessaracoccus palaemonis]|uniref:AAA family ATPase n=1 Tax=Tessaracoccus palaemonis TaxID=2829499 RepID=A0ABX8SLH3_9ACTN|nr:UvrD-helicase domain-containing protein [Tessaracoccus palaemonis]QXT62863.1 AAA family ATPase [Tessaracoccus palaemonis]